MINNPEIINRIKEQLRNTTKEQLQRAINLTDLQYNQEMNLEDNNIYTIKEEYMAFGVHRKRGNSLLNIFSKNRKREEKTELEAA